MKTSPKSPLRAPLRRRGLLLVQDLDAERMNLTVKYLRKNSKLAFATSLRKLLEPLPRLDREDRFLQAFGSPLRVL